jgi:mono/diheme cytochrome c family protein
MMRMRSCLVFVLFAFLSPLAVSRINAAEPAPGLSLSIESADGKSVDLREARLTALGVPQNSSPTPFLAPGPFRATFRAFLNLKIRDQYAFRAFGRGEIELLINGESVLKCSGDDLSATTSELIKLKKGGNEIVAKYTAPANDDAMIRLMWAEKNKPFDPIPPTVFTHDVDSSLADKLQLRQGRELVATMRCIRCHSAPVAQGAMPELSMDAPNLDDVGSRLNPQWMARWIADPKSIRSDATMPRVFAREGTQQMAEMVAAQIAAYLATKTAKSQTADQIDLSEANVIGGTRLFIGLGCIACHTAPSAQGDATRSTLRYVGAKYKPAALREYLKKPEAHYAWTRMPNFALSDDEATKLTAFLLKNSAADAIAPIDMSGADPDQGKQFFKLTGCMKCHSPDVKSVSRAAPVAELMKTDWSSACLARSGDDRGNAPDFALTDEQRAAIKAFAKTDWSALSRESSAEFSQRQIRLLNCTACHIRDVQEDMWSKLAPEIIAMQQDLPPEPPPPVEQSRPLLTWTGEKLHTEWMAKFIAGQIEYKPRPWLRSRMPAFASRAQLLAEGMTLDHGVSFTDRPEPPVDADLAALGKKLIGRNGGFSCNQCHAINKTPALVPFDSPAPNFMYVHERMRKDYYHRWTRSPSKYQPGTRMPTFADTEGKTAFKNILDGDAHQQFEAIWQYLRAGREIVSPE